MPEEGDAFKAEVRDIRYQRSDIVRRMESKMEIGK